MIIIHMATNDRILIVEHDPLIADFIARQALQAAGYQPLVIEDAGAAIAKIIQVLPEVIIVDINLPGLSAKDLLVALNSQNIEIPVIVLSQKGKESSIIDTFRLGASDYLFWPAREAEIITVVERALKQVHARRERDRLARQLEQANQELQARVRELTTILSLGKAVTSITNQQLLFEKILDGAVQITQADLGWLLLREENAKTFNLVAYRNLPESLAGRLNLPWDDGISSLVAMSGEPLSIFGDALKRFKIFAIGQSALIVPVKAQSQVIGLLSVMRRQPLQFGTGEQDLLEAAADYAAISLVNASLFRAVESRARLLQYASEHAQLGERVGAEMLEQLKKELGAPLKTAITSLERLIKEFTARWTGPQRQLLAIVQDELYLLNQITQAIQPPTATQTQYAPAGIKLNDIVQKAVSQFLPFAQPDRIIISADIPAEPISVIADAGQIGQVLAALLSNAVKFCHPGGRIIVTLEKTPSQTAHIVVQDSGHGIEASRLDKIFETNQKRTEPRRFGGLGISLSTAREIVNSYKGKMWVESKPGDGARFHFSLPLAPT